MNLTEKIIFLKENYLEKWIKERNNVERELSNNQSMFCCCGKLATGLHETYCKKFNNKVDKEVVKRLSKELLNKVE